MSKNRVVITGMGILSSLGHNKKENITQMKKGNTGVNKLQKFNTDKFISQIGAEIKEYNPSDYFTEREIEEYDRCAQYAIISIKEALDESKVLDNTSLDKVGLSFGTCNGGVNSLEEQGTIEGLDKLKTQKYPFFNQGDHVAQHFKLGGPVNTINTACAASGNAIGFGFEMVQKGYADAMIVGGSDSMSSSVYAGFNALRALNSVPCSPYNNSFGLSLGEGAAFLILETLESALSRNAIIYAEVCGYGLSSDAYHETAPHPEGLGIKKAIEYALKQSSIEREEINYINTHGTGTKANDFAELKGLEQVFGTERLKQIPISSSKAYFGHNLGAAAAIEYVTSLLAMQEDLLPATINFQEKREGCENANIITNEMKHQKTTYFLCNNSAFGGHNASIVSRIWRNQENVMGKSQNSAKVNVYITGKGNCTTLLRENQESLLDYLVDEGSISQCKNFKLKEYDSKLYERRMNSLAQYSIAAADLAIKDTSNKSSLENEDIALIYGTSRGSLQSSEKYFKSILQKGPEFASSIYFPDMVLNSVAGKVSKKLQLQGFGSSLSTGGNEGLFSAIYGYELMKDNIHSYCLVGAGDELSDLSSEIDRSLGLDKSVYPISEGSSFLMLSNKLDKETNYAEITGVGLTFGANADSVNRAIQMALNNSNNNIKDIDFIFYNSNGLPGNMAIYEGVFEQLDPKKEILKSCFNSKGYLESTSSLNHLYAAAELLGDQIKDIESINRYFSQDVTKYKKGIVVSTSMNGNNAAIVVSKVS
ncbi:beta-ketoacyl-[acyl-carrier-protein] synthase family protein [Priestia aryabhattai]|uniref:beta-ketoacyl-[acyl-carrier-protein] synthase family protein n=1 Tax=Priestia aryabhattai TaxID=412384 RepID=UPI001876446F|nr:beta-ketoacyl-[acyl-carrier-protein] synthase family protein [Priestia aryabhattai]MBE5102258.1 3-oxoacyl-ACP synthase [Priestia aryabhattai]